MSLYTRWASLERSIARHPITAFLLILYPLTWILFVPSLLGKSGFGVVPVDIPHQVSVLLTILGLTGTALIVTRITDGRAGLRALLRKYYHFIVGIQWYLLAVFRAPVLLLIVALAIRRRRPQHLRDSYVASPDDLSAQCRPHRDPGLAVRRRQRGRR